MKYIYEPTDGYLEHFAIEKSYFPGHLSITCHSQWLTAKDPNRLKPVFYLHLPNSVANTLANLVIQEAT